MIRKPARFLLTLPAILAALRIGGEAQAAGSELLTRDGVYFKREAQVAIGDSYWTIATGINLNKIQEQISAVEADLRYDPAETGVSLPSVQMRLVSGTRTLLHRLGRAKKRFEILRGAVEGAPRRVKRSPLAGVGSVMNWLFGVAKSEDLERLDQKLSKMAASTQTVLHIAEEHTTVVNETLWETRQTAKALVNVSLACNVLRKEMARLDRAMEEQKQSSSEGIARLARAEDALETLGEMVSAVEKYVDELGLDLMVAARGNVPPLFFPPDELGGVLKQIVDAMPRGWALTTSLQAGDLWHFYQEAKVTTATSKNGLKIFIQIPVVESRTAFELYKVVPLQRPVNGTLAVQFTPLPDYVAVSGDRLTFAELSKEEVQVCSKPSSTTCMIFTTLAHQVSKKACVIALFLNDPKRQQRDCHVDVQLWRGPETVYLGDRLWAYTAESEQRITMTCGSTGAGYGDTTMFLPKWGLVEVPEGCTASSEYWVFPASLQRRIAAPQKEAMLRTRWTWTTEKSRTEKPTATPNEEASIDGEIAELLKRNKIATVKNMALFEEARRTEEEIIARAGRYPTEIPILLFLLTLSVIVVTVGAVRKYLQDLSELRNENLRQKKKLQDLWEQLESAGFGEEARRDRAEALSGEQIYEPMPGQPTIPLLMTKRDVRAKFDVASGTTSIV